MITVAMHVPQNVLRDVHYYTHNGFSRITACMVQGQWRIQGVPWVPRNPSFVVLRACVAGLVRAHECSRKLSGQRNPPFKILDPPLQVALYPCTLNVHTLCSPLCFRCSCVRWNGQLHCVHCVKIHRCV